jgi:protein TonB
MRKTQITLTSIRLIKVWMIAFAICFCGSSYAQTEKTVLVSEENERVFTKVEQQPQYPGGWEAMRKFIKKNLKYPKPALRNKIEGTIYVQFIVEKDGRVSSVTTLRGISSDCDREGERVVSMMPKWTPGKNEGEYVPVRFVLPIEFKGKFKKKT